MNKLLKIIPLLFLLPIVSCSTDEGDLIVSSDSVESSTIISESEEESNSSSHTHSYGEATYKDATNHTYTCSSCNETKDEAHTLGNYIYNEQDDNCYKECTVCHHKFYEECSYGNPINVDDEHHKVVDSKTGHEKLLTHDGSYIDDGDNHHYHCDCGYQYNENHSVGEIEYQNDEHHGYTCDKCNHEIEEAHTLGSYVYNEQDDNCYRECNGCAHKFYETCDYGTPTNIDSNEGHKVTDSKTGHEKIVEHNFNEGVILTWATYDDYTMKLTKGTKEVTCLDCGYVTIVQHSTTHNI